MKQFLFILFLFTFSNIFGQSDTVFIKYDHAKIENKINYKVDTVIFRTANARQILYGTTVLPFTANQSSANNYGVFFNKIIQTSCKPNRKPIGKDYIVSIIETDTTLNIELDITGNCCHSFLADIGVENESVLNLIYYGYSPTNCTCMCRYGLTFKIIKTQSPGFSKLTSVIINGDQKSLKLLK